MDSAKQKHRHVFSFSTWARHVEPSVRYDVPPSAQQFFASIGAPVRMTVPSCRVEESDPVYSSNAKFIVIE